MKTRTILALIGLAITLTGFFLPWVDFYGHLSGKDIVLICWPSRPGFAAINLFSLFLLIPVCAIGSCLLIWWRSYISLLIVQVLLIDILLALALAGIKGVSGMSGMMYGFPVIFTGVLILNVMTIAALFRSAREKGASDD